MKQKIQTDQAPKAIGAYSQAIKVEKTVYLSGQIPLNPASMSLVSENFIDQAVQVFNNLQAVCQAAGGDLDGIVKLTIYLTDLSNFASVNEVMEKFFQEPYPARATIQISALPKCALIEVDAILVI